MPTTPKCFVPKCTHRRSNSRCIFFTFPENVNRCKRWVQTVGVEDFVHLPISFLSKNRFVCRCHFRDSDFCSPQKKRLKKFAEPTLFSTLIKPISDDLIKEFPPESTTGGLNAKKVQLTNVTNLIKTSSISSTADVINDFEHHGTQFGEYSKKKSSVKTENGVDKASEDSPVKTKKYRLLVAVTKFTNKKISSDVTTPAKEITLGVNRLLNSIRSKEKEIAMTRFNQSLTCN